MHRPYSLRETKDAQRVACFKFLGSVELKINANSVGPNDKKNEYNLRAQAEPVLTEALVTPWVAEAVVTMRQLGIAIDASMVNKAVVGFTHRGIKNYWDLEPDRSEKMGEAFKILEESCPGFILTLSKILAIHARDGEARKRVAWFSWAVANLDMTPAIVNSAVKILSYFKAVNSSSQYGPRMLANSSRKEWLIWSLGYLRKTPGFHQNSALHEMIADLLNDEDCSVRLESVKAIRDVNPLQFAMARIEGQFDLRAADLSELPPEVISYLKETLKTSRDQDVRLRVVEMLQSSNEYLDFLEDVWHHDKNLKIVTIVTYIILHKNHSRLLELWRQNPKRQSICTIFGMIGGEVSWPLNQELANFLVNLDPLNMNRSESHRIEWVLLTRDILPEDYDETRDVLFPKLKDYARQDQNYCLRVAARKAILKHFRDEPEAWNLILEAIADDNQLDNHRIQMIDDIPTSSVLGSESVQEAIETLALKTGLVGRAARNKLRQAGLLEKL